jgi:hypothetical protein
LLSSFLPPSDAMMGRRARRYREESEIMPGWKEIRSIADVAQPRQPLYAVGRGERLDGPCSILFRLARLALAHSPRAIRFPEPRSDRTGCEALLVRPA